MNNELIGRIDRMLCCYPTKTINKVLQDCKSALTQQQEAEPVSHASWKFTELLRGLGMTGAINNHPSALYAQGKRIADLLDAAKEPRSAAQPQVPEGKLLVDDIPVIAIKNGNIWHTEVSENLVTDDDLVYLYAANTRAMLYAATEEGK